MWEIKGRAKSRMTWATGVVGGRPWGKRFRGNKNLILDILSLKFILNIKSKVSNVQILDFRGKVAGRGVTWEPQRRWCSVGAYSS